jgi:Flp pilus assembly protein protease CpaA
MARALLYSYAGGLMASEGNSSGIVAIFAILMILLVGGFVAYRMGAFGGGDSKHSIDVNVK